MIFNKKKLLVSLFLLSVMFNYSTLAGNIVSVGDTLIPRGEIYSIPINAYIASNHLDSIEIEFEFNPFIIDIKSAEIKPNYVLYSSEISFTSNLTPLIGKFTVKIKNINVGTVNSALFDLKIEGLVSADSVTDFKTSKLIINGINSEYTANNAIIKVTGEAILQNYPEGLFINFPNPFRGTTTFSLNIENKSTAKFELYNSLGIKIFDECDILSRLKLIKIGINGANQNIDDITKELEPGKYYLIFNADESVLASNYLIMVMKTNKESYSKSFLLVK
jgi:hypothetical protein